MRSPYADDPQFTKFQLFPDETTLATIPSTRFQPEAVTSIGAGLSAHGLFQWDPLSIAAPAPGSVIVPPDIAASAAYLSLPSSAPGRHVNVLTNSAITSTDGKGSVRCAAPANLVATRVGNVLTANANGALATQDGVTLAVGDRLVVPFQTTGADNGIYTVTSLGAAGAPYVLTRSLDADSDAEVTAQLAVRVESGTLHAGSLWVLDTVGSTLNTTALVFRKTTQEFTLTIATGGTVALAAGIWVTARTGVSWELVTPSGTRGAGGLKIAKVPGGPGTGSVTITAVDLSGATVSTDTSTYRIKLVD